MICRQCPACDENWFSARTTPWLCEKCGTELTDEHNRPLICKLDERELSLLSTLVVLRKDKLEERIEDRAKKEQDDLRPLATKRDLHEHASLTRLFDKLVRMSAERVCGGHGSDEGYGS